MLNLSLAWLRHRLRFAYLSPCALDLALLGLGSPTLGGEPRIQFYIEAFLRVYHYGKECVAQVHTGICPPGNSSVVLQTY